MEKYIPGTHILFCEFRCHHCGGLPPDFHDRDGQTSEYYGLLFSVYEQIRKGYGQPLPISRGWSCGDHQLFIYLSKVRAKYRQLDKETILRVIQDASITPFSTHLFGALDLAPKPANWRQLDEGKLKEAVRRECLKVAEEARMAKPRPRIGASYGTHVHIDLGYMIRPRYSAKLRAGAEW